MQEDPSNPAAELPIDIQQASSIGNFETEIVTFDEAWEVYFAKWVVPNNARPDNENSRYGRHIAPKFGNIPLQVVKSLALAQIRLKF